MFTPLTNDPEQPLIFAEVQYQPDENFYDRLFSEITLYLRQHRPRRPWRMLVIYPARITEKPAHIDFRPFMGLPQLHRVYLEDFQHGEGPTPALDLLRLIACDTQQTPRLARAWIERYTKPSADMLDFIKTILVYKLPRLSREEIRAMLSLNDVSLKETRIYQEVKAEGQGQGLEQGIKRGKQQLLERMLVRRSGAAALADIFDGFAS